MIGCLRAPKGNRYDKSLGHVVVVVVVVIMIMVMAPLENELNASSVGLDE